MISFEGALEMVRREGAARRLSVERIPVGRLLESFPRAFTLGEEVSSGEFLPEFDNSAVDGFAVRLQDLKGPLPVAGRALPGERPRELLSATAMEIMTGAPVPLGADALLKVEDTFVRNGKIEFEVVNASANLIRRRGTDYQAGDAIARVGTALGARELMAFAALGVREVPVFRKPKVHLISTGNELVDAFKEHKAEGRIRNATAPFLVSELRNLGCEVRGPFPVNDDAVSGERCFDRVLQEALEEGADLVISTGAVSMGVHDFVKEAVARAGGSSGFHRTAIRPGKPLLFSGFRDHPRTLFFGLPGNPVSTAVGLEFFVKPCVRAMRGQGAFRTIPAFLRSEVKKPAELTCFFRARWGVDSDLRSAAEILPGQGSFMIHSLREANAWAMMPSGIEALAAGSKIDLILFEGDS